MSGDAKEASKDHQNGVDGVCKSTDPSECDPCIEEKPQSNQFWGRTEAKLRAKSGLSQRGLYYVGGLILVLLLFFIIIVILGALWPTTPHQHQFPVCNDAACLRASAQIQQYMNQSAPKCADIANWACGNWLSENTLPADRSKWNQRQERIKQEAVRIRELITTLPLPLNRGTVEWKLKHFYEACIEVDNVNTDRERPLTTIISELGGWNILRDWNMVDFDYKMILNHLHVKYGVTPYFKISVIPNPGSPGTSSIAIMPSGLGLPDRSYYYMPQNDTVIRAYKQLIRDVVINLSAPKTGAEKFGNDIFYYEQRIAEITPESIDLIDPTKTYNPIKVSELKFTTSTLPLLDILTAMFPTANIDGDTEVIVAHQDYLLKVSQIIATTDRASMNSYMIWTLVRKYLPYLSSQYTAAVDAFNSELYGIKKPLQRWEFCTNLIQKFMHIAIDTIREHQQPIQSVTRSTVEHVFDSIKIIAKEHITKHETKPELFLHLNKKISSLNLQIGLPSITLNETYIKNMYNKLIILKANLFESYKNGISFLKKIEEQRLVHTETDDYVINVCLRRPLDVQYVATSNTVIVPRALLTAPYFEDRYPKSVIYGRLGVAIAEAVISSITPYESAWTGDMKLLTSFHLSVNDSQKLIQNPTKCLSSFIRRKKFSKADRANLTALSTYKYLSALNVAHEALGSSLKNDAHIHQPSLEIYEDSAIFYITQIQSLCTIGTNQQELFDNIVHFRLSKMSLLQTAWHQDKSLTSSLQCDTPSESRCSDIF